MSDAAAKRKLVAAGTKGQARPASIEPLVETMDLGIETLHPGGLKATREMAELAGIDKGSEVLDIASGTGAGACFLASTYGCLVSGIDLSQDMVARATRKAQKLRLDVEFTTGDAHQLPYEDDRFDVVVCECTLCFLDNERAIAEMVRVAKPGGRVAMHDLAWKEDAPAVLVEKLARLENEHPETFAGWKRLFETTGLEDYRERHHIAAWALARIFAHSDFDSLAEGLQVVAFAVDHDSRADWPSRPAGRSGEQRRH